MNPNKEQSGEIKVEKNELSRLKEEMEKEFNGFYGGYEKGHRGITEYIECVNQIIEKAHTAGRKDGMKTSEITAEANYEKGRQDVLEEIEKEIPEEKTDINYPDMFYHKNAEKIGFNKCRIKMVEIITRLKKMK